MMPFKSLLFSTRYNDVISTLINSKVQYKNFASLKRPNSHTVPILNIGLVLELRTYISAFYNSTYGIFVNCIKAGLFVNRFKCKLII